MNYSAGLTFGQVQITLCLYVSISPCVGQDNNTALISLINRKSIFVNYLQPRDKDPWLIAERGHWFVLLPKSRKFIKKTATKKIHVGVLRISAQD